MDTLGWVGVGIAVICGGLLVKDYCELSSERRTKQTKRLRRKVLQIALEKEKTDKGRKAIVNEMLANELRGC
jgi:hypothetical protein